MHKTRYPVVLLLVVALLVPGLAVGCGEQQSKAQQAYEKAQELESEAMLTRAEAEYSRAHDLFQEEGKEAEALRARRAAQSVVFVKESYPDLEADVEKKLAELYPQVPEERRRGWIDGGELEHMTWDGKVHYFGEAANNIATREFDIAYQDTEKSEGIAQLVRTISSSSAGEAATWQPYSNPLTWLGTQSVSVPPVTSYLPTSPMSAITNSTTVSSSVTGGSPSVK